jgi:hypothetical protein
MNWWEYQKLVDRGPFMTSADHRIVIKRESIPIIFVPGIMGSRLKRGSEKVWDPNSSWFMVKTYLFASPARRKSLITDPGLSVDVDASEDFRSQIEMETLGGAGAWVISEMPGSMQQEYYAKASKRGDMAVKQGWGGVAWSFYGNLIQRLADEKWDPFNKCFVFPVYAAGYNWVQDNRISGDQLSAQIRDIINKEASKGLVCERAVVVSHSMGGLVSRAAAKLAGAESSLLGMLHGAQPALGAPAAYRRMRAGFESAPNLMGQIGSGVLGSTSQKVMPVLGNSVGGMELLPTQFYRTNSGQMRWLTMYNEDGNAISIRPEKMDPYISIYEDDSIFLRLAYHPEYLDPDTSKKPATSTEDPVRKARVAFVGNLRQARAFHENLKLACHSTTYSTWVEGSGKPTWDKIDYKFLQKRYEPRSAFVVGGAAEFPSYVSLNPEEGQGIEYWESKAHPEQDGYYSLQDQSGEGDGTVPVSSGSALKSNSLKTKIIKDVEHGDFFNDDGAQQFTVNCILEIAKKQFDSRMSSCNISDGK